MKIRKRTRPTRSATSEIKVDFEQLTNVLAVLQDLGTGSRLQFLVAPRQSLGGATPLQALADGRYEKVMDIAAAFAEVPTEYIFRALAGVPRDVLSKSLTRLSRVSRELLETARELHHHGLMSDAALSQAVLLAHAKPMSYAAVQTIIAKRYPGAIERPDLIDEELDRIRAPASRLDEMQ